MKKSVIFISMLCVLLCFGGCFSSMSAQWGSETLAPKASDYEQKLKEVVELLDQVYVDGYNTEELGDYLAAAAVSATGDRWSHYYTAKEYREYLEDSKNAYVGVGITVQQVSDECQDLYVLAVTPGGSASAAGVLPGDVIYAVDGVLAQEVGMDAVSGAIRGEEGTTLVLSIHRGEEDLDLTLTRKLIEVPVVIYDNIDGIGYIKIENFHDHCAERGKEAIDDLLAQKVQGIVFDVRFNPGGKKTELVDLLDYILPEGPLFRSVDYEGTVLVDSSDAEQFVELPMTVLVNGDSYSAAEFFAAALQEYGWAKVVGTQTVGKGNYQQTFPLSDGSAVAVSTGHYSTPNGVNLEGVGITPDVTVEIDEELYYGIYSQSISYDEDPQLQAALEEIKNNT